jgi:hypothetical protein
MFKPWIVKRSYPIVHRFKYFFKLPDCYLKIKRDKECKKSRLSVGLDLLELFFSYKTFPDHYGPCRLWEVEKSQWKYYYGSNYQTYQQLRLSRTVQPWEYSALFYDKEVCQILCRGIGVNIPYMFGVIGPEQNYKERINSFIQNDSVDSLIIKPAKGRSGIGIVLVKKENNNIIIQSKTGVFPLKDFNLSETAIVQEVIKQDRKMSAFSSSSVNTIRVVTMYTKKESVIVLGAYLRCGIGESFVDNVTSGGVAVGIDSESGKLKKFAYNKEGTRYIGHPTSKVMFEGFVIPQWQSVIDLAITVQKALPCYRILGMDIAIRENEEPVLIEVNIMPDLLGLERSCGPLLRIEQNLHAFGEYDLFVNRHQRELYRAEAQRSV